LGFKLGNQSKLTFFSVANHYRKNISPRGIGQAGGYLAFVSRPP
jgi:hypothetical protein